MQLMCSATGIVLGVHRKRLHKERSPEGAHWMTQGHSGRGEKVEGASRPQLTLLYDISGAFCPGRLTCLMGVSGAGKTTLMDVLAGRKTGAPDFCGMVHLFVLYHLS